MTARPDQTRSRREPRAAADERGRRGEGGADRQQVPPHPSRGGTDLLPPAAAELRPHQGVVGVAGLNGDAAAPAAARPDGMDRDPLAPDDVEARSQRPYGQVGVLPERSGEAFVEAAGRLQHGAPVGHVGRDPALPRPIRGSVVPRRSAGAPRATAPRAGPGWLRPIRAARRDRPPAERSSRPPGPRRRRRRRSTRGPVQHPRPPASRCCGRPPDPGRRCEPRSAGRESTGRSSGGAAAEEDRSSATTMHTGCGSRSALWINSARPVRPIVGMTTA